MVSNVTIDRKAQGKGHQCDCNAPGVASVHWLYHQVEHNLFATIVLLKEKLLLKVQGKYLLYSRQAVPL